MRPTDLQFRSPKEATPGPYRPMVTAHGKRLAYEERVRRCTFGVSKRFRQYDIDSKRVGTFVAPGSYNIDNLSIGKAHLTGVAPYRPTHDDRDPEDNGYFYIGNHLVYDPNFSRSMSRRRSSMHCSRQSSHRSVRPQSAARRTPTPDESRRGRSASRRGRNEVDLIAEFYDEDDRKHII